MNKLICAAICSLALASGAQAGALRPAQCQTIEISRPGMRLEVEAESAVTEREQAHGLMERSDLTPLSAMIFPHDPKKPAKIWMANTPLALDIMFFGSDGRMVWVAKAAAPESKSIISPPKGTRVAYMLEMPAGIVDTLGLEAGSGAKAARLKLRPLRPCTPPSS